MYLEDYVNGVEEAEESLCEDPTNKSAYIV